MKLSSKDVHKRLEEFKNACRQQGLPVTVQRRAVYEEILGRDDHPTADRLFEDVSARIPGVSRTTVYRVLNVLVQLGLVTKIHQPGAAARFDAGVHPHHHLACIHCDKVVDLTDERLDRIKLPEIRYRGFQITEPHIYFRGICRACRDARSSGSAKPARTGTNS